MKLRIGKIALAGAMAAGASFVSLCAWGQVAQDLYSGLKWRNIGPFRGGRVASVTGVIGQPGVFYIGLPNGGVWKTVSAGEVWYPIFDAVTGADCVGAIEVAPSDPNIIYAGTGDLVTGGGINVGDGMYKSTDAGKTWARIGLEGTEHINSILVDPKNPDLVLASTQGNLRTPGADRGVYRSTDGGRNWTRVLHPDDSTGARDMAWAYDDPQVIFATTIADIMGGGGAGRGPAAGAAGAAPVNRTRLYKSTDEGVSWSEVAGANAPPMNGRMGVAVAMHTHGQRIYLIGGAVQGGSGLFRSDDQGATWKHMAAGDTRVTNGQGTYSCGVWVDPQNPDILYTVSTSTYRSTDGGNTFASFKGAPGGDDYHAVWIDPTDGQRMIYGTDQGATVSFDGGHTWSTWYNQATDQVYHITTDTRYPYWVLAPQQDSGSTMVRSRSDLGEVTPLDWYPLPAYEFGSIASDPLNPNIIYAQGPSPGSVVKIVQPTWQWENVSPSFGNPNLRAANNAMRRFDTTFDKHALYMAYQCLTVTRDGGMSWKPASPDATTMKGEPGESCEAETPAGPGAARGGAAARGAVTPPAAAPTAPPLPGAAPGTPAAGAGRGGRGGGRGASIDDFSISTFRPGVIWTGSSNGQVFNTLDGIHWNNVTNFTDLPAGAVDFNAVEAGHFDVNTAYVATDRHGAGDYAPHIWRTHDGGKTWTGIVNGLPTTDRTGDFVRVVREDPKQKGLLYCGTETSVYVSFDDGDHWQSLRLNLPTTSFRDMEIHSGDHMNDLVVGTYGRSFWVLDDITPLRQIAQKAQAIAAAPAYLFQPGDAIRARYNINEDTPFPPEVPHADNPPYGALIYYHLNRPAQGEVKLQVFDAEGRLVRTLSSNVPPWTQAPAPVPDYWLKTPRATALPTEAGMHRVHWDLQYEDPPNFSADIENQMNAIPGETTYGPHGPLALPGTYTIKLTVDGQVYAQPLVVHNDPRVGESAATMAGLRAQHKLILLAYQGMKDTYTGNTEVASVRASLKSLIAGQLPPEVAAAATALDTRLGTMSAPAGGGRGGRGRGAAPPGTVLPFATINGDFANLVNSDNVGGLDMAPNQPQIQAWINACQAFDTAVAAWKTIQTQDVAAFNSLLVKNNLPAMTATPTTLSDPPCVWAPPASSTAAAPAAGH